MLSSLAADEKPSATATTKCTCSVNLGLESIEIRWLLDIFMVLVRKLPYYQYLMVRRQNTRGIIVSMRWLTLAFYLLSSLACCLLKEVS